MDIIRELLKHMRTLDRDTNPILAAGIGLLAGGLGLAIYFRSVADFFAPMALFLLAIVLNSSLAGAGVYGGIALAAVYGYLRANDSNERRAASTT
jgi:hypothetical protein